MIAITVAAQRRFGVGFRTTGNRIGGLSCWIRSIEALLEHARMRFDHVLKKFRLAFEYLEAEFALEGWRGCGAVVAVNAVLLLFGLFWLLFRRELWCGSLTRWLLLLLKGFVQIWTSGRFTL
jgi:hypothetical protein